MISHQFVGLGLILSGCLLSLAAALGFIRLDDFYCRLHAVSVAGSASFVLFLSGAACYFWNWQVLGLCLAVLIIHWLTSPLATHLIARAAYLGKSPLWKNTREDELSKDAASVYAKSNESVLK